jgi:hypothetical protein
MKNLEQSLHTETLHEVTIADLGSGNLGKISCADLDSEQRQLEIERVSNPESFRLPTKRFRCVDGRRPSEGVIAPEGFTDPQIAGGLAISETAADFMLSKNSHMPLSELLKINTLSIMSDGMDVIMHGDESTGKNGCGANALIRNTLLYNDENRDVIIHTALLLGEKLGLSIDKKTADQLIDNGKNHALKDAMWDVDPSKSVNITVEKGAKYEKLLGSHEEKSIVVPLGNFTVEAKDAFVVSLGAYKESLLERTKEKDISPHEIEKRIMAVILFNIGVAKQLTAEETGNGEALPVVIIEK